MPFIATLNRSFTEGDHVLEALILRPVSSVTARSRGNHYVVPLNLCVSQLRNRWSVE